MFHRLPTLDELLALEAEGVRADIIVVDARRDKKLTMLKQLILALVRGNSNPAAMIKRIAGLVRNDIVISTKLFLFGFYLALHLLVLGVGLLLYIGC